MKILAIKFKYVGDIALMVPALRQLREKWPKAHIDVLVLQEAMPLLQQIPWLNTIYGLRRQRPKMQALPILWALRGAEYDLSVEFAGNDRGAIVSRFIGAKQRIGPATTKRRNYCYTDTVSLEDIEEAAHDLCLLEPLGIAMPEKKQPELYSDPNLRPWAFEQIPSNAILCHITTSRASKEWPLGHWKNFYELLDAKTQKRLWFIAGHSPYEQGMLHHLEKLLPGINTLEDVPTLVHLLALMDHASLVICGDSAPAHIAEGLGKQGIVLLSPTPKERRHPFGKELRVLIPSSPDKPGQPEEWDEQPLPISEITPEAVAQALGKFLAKEEQPASAKP